MSGDASSQATGRARIYACLSPNDMGTRTCAVTKSVLIAAIIIGVVGVVLGTLPGLDGRQAVCLHGMTGLAGAMFAVEYVARIWAAPESDPASAMQPWQARWLYLRSFLGVVDLLVILPLFLGMIFPQIQGIVSPVMLLALLKSARYARSLPIFAAVFRNEGQALFSGLAVMMVLMVLVSGVMYLLERHAQPNAFSSIPDAMWWAIVTMATVGYGDVTPITPLGKLFGGFTMMLGVAMFAIPAGILVNGFAAEIRKRDFVVNWHSVANVPLFASLDASRIASIANLLKMQVLPARQVVVRRGEPADAMFFILSGEVEVDVLPKPVRLGKGQYFGEIALIKRTHRTATVTTLSECQIMLLEMADFQQLMTQYPDLKATIERVADERLRQAADTPSQQA